MMTVRQNDVPEKAVYFARDLRYSWWFISRPDFRDVTLCSMVNKYKYFSGNCCLHFTLHSTTPMKTLTVYPSAFCSLIWNIQNIFSNPLCTLLGYRLFQRTVVQLPAVARNFSLIQSIQIASGIHPASYSISIN
jgi:hypothetical protein